MTLKLELEVEIIHQLFLNAVLHGLQLSQLVAFFAMRVDQMVVMVIVFAECRELLAIADLVFVLRMDL